MILDQSRKPRAGVFLIEASAGTGKTYSIANLYLHFLLQGRKVSEILVVTFTDAATKELRERIRARLTEAFRALRGHCTDESVDAILRNYERQEAETYMEAAVLNFDQAAIFTIHGFCQRMLQENAFESLSLFDAELTENEDEIRQELVQDFIRSRTYGQAASSLTQDDLINLVKKYGGQRLVDKIDDSEFEKHKQNFLELWEEHGARQTEVLKSSKAISHAQKNPHCYDKFAAYLEAIESLKTGEKTAGLFCAVQAFSQKVILENQLKHKTAPRHELFESAERLLAFLGAAADKCDFLEYFSLNYPLKKAALNLLTFDDLIKKLNSALKKEGGNGPLHERIRRQFTAALVDEFQDTDPLQYEIFSSLFASKEHCPGHSFYMIGDPKQSIYAFRGADIFSYLEAKNNADEMFSLDTNYRSEKGLVEAVNDFFSLKGQKQAFAYAPQPGREGIYFEAVKAGAADIGNRELILESDSETAKQLQLQWIGSDDEKPPAKSVVTPLVPPIVAGEIIKLLNLSASGRAYFKSANKKEALKPGDIAILANTHSQTAEIKKELNRHGIPCVIQKSGNVFNSAEAGNLLRFLEAVVQPREKTITPLLLSSFFNCTAAEIIELSSADHFELLKEFVDYRNKWDQRGFLQTLQIFTSRHRIYQKALSLLNGERTVSNIYQLREILHEEEQTKGLGIAGLIRFLNEKIHSKDKDDERFLQRLETDENAVQILTVHKSKGLEFPVVFCPYIWTSSYGTGKWGKGEYSENGDFAFHGENNEPLFSINEMDPAREVYRNFWRREKLGEQLRLLYVALTRAASRCYLYWGDISNEPSVFTYLADPAFCAEQLLSGETPMLSPAARKQFWKETLGTRPAIAFSEVHAGYIPQLSRQHKTERTLKAPIQVNTSYSKWMNGSYSALIKYHSKVSFTLEDELTKDDDDDLTAMNLTDEEETATAFFAFPKGATPGTAIHEIFENIDFQNSDNWDLTVVEKLLKYRLHGDSDEIAVERKNACLDMLHKVLHTELSRGLSLSKVSKAQRLDEMEFYFPVKNIEIDSLISLFTEHYKDDERIVYADDLRTLNYEMDHGFLNGAVDLTFESGGKFYILDWKSNHMGNRYEDYHTQAVKDKVREKLYFLQYHIYTVALHLYLKEQLEGYSYNRHFGGVYYAFVRGMKPGENYGIHYDRVPYGLVKDLVKLFLKGGRK